MTSTKLKLGITGALCLAMACSRSQSLSIGAKGAPCTTGGGCDPGLVCVSGVCIESPALGGSPGVGGAPTSGGSPGSGGTVGTGGSPGSGGTVGTGGSPGSGDTVGTGGSPGSGGTVGTGGIGPTGGTRASGGVGMTGGIPARGGTVAAGGSSPGGTGGASCSNVVECSGDVVGTWNVTSSCLGVSGDLDMSVLGLGCLAAQVEGSLSVVGTWTAKSDGTYVDHTTTTGIEQIRLPSSCLVVSGTTTSCQALGSVIVILGYDSATCGDALNGGCDCTAVVSQTGGIGFPFLDPRTSGDYSIWGSRISTDLQLSYPYCVSGNKLTLTPGSTRPDIKGTIVLQR